MIKSLDFGRLISANLHDFSELSVNSDDADSDYEFVCLYHINGYIISGIVLGGEYFVKIELGKLLEDSSKYNSMQNYVAYGKFDYLTAISNSVQIQEIKHLFSGYLTIEEFKEKYPEVVEKYKKKNEH